MKNPLDAWAIHELILEDIRSKSGVVGMTPDRITFPDNHPTGVPPGVYEPNEDGVWILIGRGKQ